MPMQLSCFLEGRRGERGPGKEGGGGDGWEPSCTAVIKSWMVESSWGGLATWHEIIVAIDTGDTMSV